MAFEESSPLNSLISLLDEIIDKILLRASEIRVQNIFSAKMTCKTMNRLGNEPRFLKVVHFFDFDNQMPVNITMGLINFRRACAEAGKADALFMRGISAYMYEGRPTIGVADIKKAAQEGCSYANYAYKVLRKQLYPLEFDREGIIDESVPLLTRDYARSIRRKLTALKPLGFMNRPLSNYVTEALDDIGQGFIKECPCAYASEVFD